MGKQIVAVKTPTTVVYRFIGRQVYLKGNNNQYANQLIAQIKAKGGTVVFGNGWLKCDLFGTNALFKLGKWSVDFDANIVKNEETKEIQTASDSVLEEMLCDFFKHTLELSEFKCEVSYI